MFDTNVWININGFDPRPEFRVYSNYLKSLLEAGNEIVVTDLILSEFFNACCRIEHRLMKNELSDPKMSFKEFRVSEEARESIESVRDSCLNIKDDCLFDQLGINEYSVTDVISESAIGKLDYNDILIRELCSARNYVLVTHDADYKNSNVTIASANRRLLK